ncbi:hypothetical protein BEWA_027830 [Theileria equi strain WA]|uniref:Uncharacterized protein n=1 Tax=Theileria equi strain WA TaxID=1537102 RepID=L0AYI0_THEEQ|nr:hypothetical protein BEWA_027830 [Theileria equi strain WA]AFZ79934.1 hypothetical protein BEWA_027830 [Theileria equi strain WA]|eukprot:XP_004829600.1 hypothetical protein BEWA_027830 [Theileria equi strain WA]
MPDDSSAGPTDERREDPIDLNGIPDEDAKLIKHLTWLYGGYQMRQRNKNVKYTIDEEPEGNNEDDYVIPKDSSPVPADSPDKKTKNANPLPRGRPKKIRSDGDTCKRFKHTDGSMTLDGTTETLDTTTSDCSDCTFLTGTASDGEDKFAAKKNEKTIVDFRRIRYNKQDLVTHEHRRPTWPSNMQLADKISAFIHKNVADKTDFREGQEPTTLSICNQFALQNHEAMVADSDRVHYYRAAIFWTGHGSRDGTEQDSTYCKNKKVLEIGTGPMCVLAMNARNAGAKFIDAIEVSSHAARLAGKLMAAYGCDDVINVFNSHSKQFVFDQKRYFSESLSEDNEIMLPPDPPYDMIISEILGDFASQEGVADVFLDLQRRILFENKRFIGKTKSIPYAAYTMFVPSIFPDSSNILNKASSHAEMTIFSPTFRMLQSVGMRVDNLPLCDEWQPIEKLYLEEWMQPQMCQHYENLFEISYYGEFCGFLVGIDVEIRPGEHFGTRYGQCESWYTNIVLLDKEYTVYPGDFVLVRTISNLTNYVSVHCDGAKIPVSRPSYSFRAFILSDVTEEQEFQDVIEKFSNLTNDSQESKLYEYKGQACNKLECAELEKIVYTPKVKDSVPLDILNTGADSHVSTTCNIPDDWLESYEFVKTGSKIYKIVERPPPVLVDYDEQTCAIYNEPRTTRRKLPTDPPKRYQRLKGKTTS